MSDLSALSELSLINAEEGLHTLFASDGPTPAILKAHQILAKEMRERGLIYTPLTKVFLPGGAKKPAGKSDPKAGSDEDEETPGKSGASKKVDNTMAKSVDDLAADRMNQFEKRDYTAAQRREAANSGAALPDGSFPIHNEADLHNAVRLAGQANDPKAAQAHIIQRAKAMGLTNALPEDWEDESAAKKPAATQPAKKPGVGAKLGKALGSLLGNEFNADEFTKLLEDNLTSTDLYEYTVRKALDEKRYTLGPVYLPNTVDAHGEFATPDELQDSMHDYVRKTGSERTIFLEHTSKPAGEWVEIVSWPEEWVSTLTKSIDGIEKSINTTFPAGTVYMGVIWEPWAWESVKKGELTGFSMGGMARRVEAEIV